MPPLDREGRRRAEESGLARGIDGGYPDYYRMTEWAENLDADDWLRRAMYDENLIMDNAAWLDAHDVPNIEQWDGVSIHATSADDWAVEIVVDGETYRIEMADDWIGAWDLYDWAVEGRGVEGEKEVDY